MFIYLKLKNGNVRFGWVKICISININSTIELKLSNEIII